MQKIDSRNNPMVSALVNNYDKLEFCICKLNKRMVAD